MLLNWCWHTKNELWWRGQVAFKGAHEAACISSARLCPPQHRSSAMWNFCVIYRVICTKVSITVRNWRREMRMVNMDDSPMRQFPTFFLLTSPLLFLLHSLSSFYRCRIERPLWLTSLSPSLLPLSFKGPLVLAQSYLICPGDRSSSNRSIF